MSGNRETAIVASVCVFAAWFMALPSSAATTEAGGAPVLTVLDRTAEPLLKPDRPWEGMSLGYCTVLRIGQQWHMWYSSCDRNYRDDRDSYLCYARSDDGLHWTKPDLGIYSYKGSKANNVLCFGTHGITVFLDEQTPADERFKAVGVRMDQARGTWCIYGAVSSDGIHWRWRKEPLLPKNSDTANVCFHDGGVYRLYVRMWTGPGTYGGYRIVGYTESATFGAFSAPKVILKPDKQDPVDFHLYNSAAMKLRDDMYLMLPSGFFTKSGKVLVYAAFSRDGKCFQRLGRTPLLDVGKGFDKMGIYVGAGAIPAEKPGTYWVYYLGTALSHDVKPADSRFDGGIGRFLLKVAE
jgi:hypothetical protein